MKEMGGQRSASEKEKTKMRERQRRSVTTKIFHGLRKHGGYHLSPRADINEVLRHLAHEAGWVVEPDGTTYRPLSSTPKASNSCSVCGIVGKRSGTSTPTSSFIGVGGESSTTASPPNFPTGDSFLGGPTSAYFGCGAGSGTSSLTSERDIPIHVSMYAGMGSGLHTSAVVSPPQMVALAFEQQQQMYLEEARASNQNTPVGSPRRRT